MQASASETIPDLTKSIVRGTVHGTLATYAKAGKHGPFRAARLFQEICDKLAEADVIPPGPGGSNLTDLNPDDQSLPTDFDVPPHIARFVRGVLWQLYLQGVLAPAPERECPARVDRKPPFSYLDIDCCVLTQYGQDILTDATNRIQVHDQDGYLGNFWNADPPPDEEMMRYVQESVAVFRGAHFLATVVLLGVASERLIEVLAETLRDALGDPRGTNWFNEKYINKRDISKRFSALSGKLMGEYGKDLNREKQKDAFDGIVTLTFEQIRNARNDIAHPRGREFTWNEVSGLLHNFVQYFIYTNRIIAFLSSDRKTA